MKKIIALALALVMALSMASVAFAADPLAGALITKDTEGCDEPCEHLLPGETYTIDSVMTKAGEITKDYKVTAKWTKGGALVKGIAWNKDDGVWELTLNENYTITTAKALEGTITFEGKGAKKDVDFDVKIVDVVNNHLVTVYGEEDKDDALVIEAANNTLYQCEEDEAGYVKFNKGALLSATLNMASEEKAFMYNDEAAIDALTEKFPDADIECYNFGGSPVFKNEAEFTLQADYADQYYVYTYTNGKLEAQDYEWDSIEGVYTWATKTPTSYVISDVELVAAAEEETKNPDTGANDVVGVAAALAVVSLVAAGAVSLKK